jgi:hypothetical protein
MTAPIELSLFRIVLFRLHTPQLCEPHLTRGRLVAENYRIQRKRTLLGRFAQALGFAHLSQRFAS